MVVLFHFSRGIQVDPAVGVKPGRKLPAKGQRTVTESGCTAGVAFGRIDAVENAVILDRPGDIVIALRFDARVSIRIPAVAHIPGFYLCQVLFHQLRVAARPDRVERKVDQHPEEQPVAVGKLAGIDLTQPGRKVLPGLFRERVQQCVHKGLKICLCLQAKGRHRAPPCCMDQNVRRCAGRFTLCSPRRGFLPNGGGAGGRRAWGGGPG